MKSKKLLSIMLATFLIAVLPKTFAASETGALSVSSVSARPGGEVTVDVTIDENPGIVALAFAVSWEGASRLTLKSTDALENKEDHVFIVETRLDVANVNGKYFYSTNSYALSDYTSTGKLVSLTFIVNETGAEGDIPLTLEVFGENTFNFSKKDIPFTANSGKIILTEQPPASPPPTSASETVLPSESVSVSVSETVSASESVSVSETVSPSETVTVSASESASVSPSESVSSITTTNISAITSVITTTVTSTASSTISSTISVSASVPPSVSVSAPTSAPTSPPVTSSSILITASATAPATASIAAPTRSYWNPAPLLPTGARVTAGVTTGDYMAETYSGAELENILRLSDSPVIVLGGYKKGANIPGKLVLEFAKNGKSIDVKKDDFTFTLAPELASELKIGGDSTLAVGVVSEAAALPKPEIDRIIKTDPANETALNQTCNLSISVDGKKIAKTLSPIKIAVDVTGTGIADKANASGVYFNPASKSFFKLGGEFSPNGRSFEFYTNNVGLVGVIVADNLQKLSLTIGVKSASKSENAEVKYIQNDVAPFISNENRTMIPLRLVAETMGAEVGWMESLRAATISMNGKTIYLKVGEPLSDGMGTPVISESRTFVPIRYVAESFNANVVWNQENRNVKIYY